MWVVDNVGFWSDSVNVTIADVITYYDIAFEGTSSRLSASLWLRSVAQTLHNGPHHCCMFEGTA